MDNQPKRENPTLYKLSDLGGTWKKQWGKLWDGRRVFLVNGDYVRDHHDTDFVMGGSHEAYPDYIPKNEIWWEYLPNPEDNSNDYWHELFESTLMKYGILKDYDRAHEATRVAEALARKTRLLDAPGKLSKLAGKE